MISQSPFDLGATDLVTHYLHHAKQLRSPVPHREFMPRKGEVSVAHISGLTEEAVWAVGQHTLNTGAGRTRVLGRADLSVAVVQNVGLRAARDDIGFERHSLITDWPGGDDADVRHKEIAKELAMAAKLVIK